MRDIKPTLDPESRLEAKEAKNTLKTALSEVHKSFDRLNRYFDKLTIIVDPEYLKR